MVRLLLYLACLCSKFTQYHNSLIRALELPLNDYNDKCKGGCKVGYTEYSLKEFAVYLSIAVSL